MSQVIEVKVPDIGGYNDVPVIEVLVKAGDRVEAETSLVTLESDKATMDVPSPSAGVVKDIKVKVGDTVSEGSLIIMLESADGAAPAAVNGKAAASAPAPAAPAAAAPATPTAPAPAGGTTEVKVPDIGGYNDVPIIEVLVKAGDKVEAEQSLITLESDKATMDVPSPSAGVVKEVKVKVGDTVSEGSVIILLEGGAAPAQTQATAPAAQPAAPAAAAPQVEVPKAPAPAKAAEPAAPLVPLVQEGEHTISHASPSVRKFARELGVDVARVPGSGPKGRITLDDVRAFIKRAMSGQGAAVSAPASGGAGLDLLPWPKIDFAKFGPVEPKPLSRIKKISGANLHRNWVMIPHVTNNDNADITDLEAFRVLLNKENEKSGVKVTLLAFLIKACVAALKKFPTFNASLDGDNLVYKQYFNIGFAADTPNGLMVPVIKDADKKGIFEIARETSELAKAARDGKLKPDQMQGGCFSISSLGGIGGTYFTPIINAPEVAILGVCRSTQQPVWDDAKQQFVPRLILPLSLSYDHRVIDGAEAARFNTYLAQLLHDFRRAML
ncbi:dihydrolipoamide acetyltransferase [Pandoraea thiooxydans]|uniref:Acetyltransferase component of pyruvate dehydrogenase complex n=1 Tax=Pandoraea thiooxydans TaxID=445709 RepID=A0A0G3EQ61_9BURK|nr:dihydrolipoyllysine-residue acetyltransferase [Pandoraea thiooxydans]AKJ67427.1 dihydrolipoyllysine-residue acetyltransferase [Pandoraea thiooxydans]APR94456.1 dihydrolipoamide acetyltransferase [Pandoraea thiooxydans]